MSRRARLQSYFQWFAGQSTICPMTTMIYKAKGRSIIPGGWGDYGDILQQGMSARLERSDGRLALERTGPFVPPITFPGIGEIVINSDVRDALEFSRLTGFSFSPVEKVRIVDLRWEEWDLEADEPPEYPETGEPEDFISQREHDREIAKEMGDLWQIVVPQTATVLRPRRIVESYRELTLDLSTWNGKDLFRSRDIASMLFSERAREWFTELWGEYIQFDLFPTTEGD